MTRSHPEDLDRVLRELAAQALLLEFETLDAADDR